jgi:hypothetical protein
MNYKWDVNPGANYQFKNGESGSGHSLSVALGWDLEFTPTSAASQHRNVWTLRVIH